MDPSKLIDLIKSVAGVPGDVNALMNTVLKFVDLLKKTPQENHDAIVAKVREEAAKFELTGRPSR